MSVTRSLGRLVMVTGVAAAAVAVGRVALGRLAGDPATPQLRGSFDTWPAVPAAPGRTTANGSASPPVD